MNRPNSSHPSSAVRWLAGVLATLAALSAALSPGVAAAQITVTVPSLSVPESSSTQTGTFDVSVTTSGDSLPAVGDFTVNLQLSPASGVTFTGGEATTADPYIFAGQTSGPSVSLSNGDTTIIGADFVLSNEPTLANGDGLLAVNYSIPANTSGTFDLTIATTGYDPTVLDDPTPAPISFTVQNATLTVVPATVYWNGGIDSNWNTLQANNSYATNWSTTASGFTDAHALPGANTDVIFNGGGGSNVNTTLGADLSINSLTFTSTATNPVSISGNTLTIGAGGLTVQSGAAAATINSGVTLSASQTWTIAGSNPLTLGGTLSLTGQTLTKAGNGTLRIDTAPSLGNGSTLAVNAGTVQLDLTSGAASIGSNVTATVAPSATLQLAGSVSALSDASLISPGDGNVANINNDGSTASGGGLLVTGTNQSVGVVSGQGTTSGGQTTYTGDTVVGDGTNAASLTVSQILQNSLVINAGSTVTIRPSGAGASMGAAPASSGAAPATASSTSVTPSAAPSTAASTIAPAAPSDDPFLTIQNVLASGSGGTATATPSTAALAPIEAAIASVVPAAPPTDSVDAGDSTVYAAASVSQPAVGTATADDADAIASSAAGTAQFQPDDGLAFSASAAAASAFDAGVPAFGAANSVPEPSTLALLLLGSAAAGSALLKRKAAKVV